VLKNIFLITLFFVDYQIGFSQQKLPILQSDSNSVSIKIDGNTVAVWNIDPDTKPWTEPDVFTIERSFKERKVTYLSNRDSLSFTVKPGGKYDFTIIIKNRGAFPMRLTTLTGERLLVVVGGPHIGTSFLKEQLIDELWLTFEPKIFGIGGNFVTDEKLDINLRLIHYAKVNEQGTLITKYVVLKK
jgi:dihydrofolate reductase